MKRWLNHNSKKVLQQFRNQIGVFFTQGLSHVKILHLLGRLGFVMPVTVKHADIFQRAFVSI